MSIDMGPIPGDDAPPVGPVPLIAGTFAVYDDGQGGYVLVTDTPDAGTARRHIPAALVKLATGGGLAGRLFGKMSGG